MLSFSVVEKCVFRWHPGKEPCVTEKTAKRKRRLSELTAGIRSGLMLFDAHEMIADAENVSGADREDDIARLCG